MGCESNPSELSCFTLKIPTSEGRETRWVIARSIGDPEKNDRPAAVRSNVRVPSTTSQVPVTAHNPGPGHRCAPCICPVVKTAAGQPWIYLRAKNTNTYWLGARASLIRIPKTNVAVNGTGHGIGRAPSSAPARVLNSSIPGPGALAARNHPGGTRLINSRLSPPVHGLAINPIIGTRDPGWWWGRRSRFSREDRAEESRTIIITLSSSPGDFPWSGSGPYLWHRP